MKTFATRIGVALLFASASAAAAQEGTLLRYLPSKEPLVYRKTSTMKQTQDVMCKKIISEMKQSELDVWTIAANDKKELAVKTETKRLEVKMKFGPLGDYAFDSRKDDNEKGSRIELLERLPE